MEKNCVFLDQLIQIKKPDKHFCTDFLFRSENRNNKLQIACEKLL